MYEWDEAKRRQNLATHKVDFADAAAFEWVEAVVRSDTRQDYREPRFIAYGPIGDRLHCLVFTRRGDTIRIISLRRANRREVRRYEEDVGNSD